MALSEHQATLAFIEETMRYLFITLLLILTSCSPRNDYVLTEQQIDSLDVALWKASQVKADGCSAPAPIKWLARTFLDKNWSDCCYQHDFDYSYGYEYNISKDQADYSLWHCVDATGHPVVANIMYTGVSLLGDNSYETGD
jgi:hypothetical protein